MTDWLGLLAGGLNLVNQVLSATIVLTSFSLLIYLLTHNLRSGVARAFCSLLFFVLIVFAGDVVLYEVETQAAATRWLKFQWIGIALVPAAYLHFSMALLRTVGLRRPWHRVAVALGYCFSIFCLGLVVFTDLLVYDGFFIPHASQLAAGPLFWIFALFFFVAVAWGAANVIRARRRCLTRASRRRMTYLSITFVAPALGVFPYLLLTSMPTSLPTYLFLGLLIVGNVGILLMIVVMAYSVAFFGALTPDRVVKHSLIHYLLRGPLVGAVVIFTMLAVPKVEQILGLPRDTVLIFAVVGVIVLFQLTINLLKPFIDQLIYRQDRGEIVWIQTLDRRLLTTSDLETFLESTLAALCDLLQVQTGFVSVPYRDQYQLVASCGDKLLVQALLESRHLGAGAATPPGEQTDLGFVPENGFWLLSLYSQSNDIELGMLGVEARAPTPNLELGEQEIAGLLVSRAREAMEDRYLQQGIFGTLSRILPNLERLHRWQDATRYVGAPALVTAQESPVHSPEFQQWVRDALSHYWGGPKLTESPLLGLNIVQDTVREQGSPPAHALRTVLYEAIERLKPGGERKMTATEWILYNILEMKFIRGLRVRDIAYRLAMSESDLYRKQRVAITEVAKALAEWEVNGGASAHGNGNRARPQLATAERSHGMVEKDRLDNQI